MLRQFIIRGCAEFVALPGMWEGFKEAPDIDGENIGRGSRRHESKP
jgi:hypothetical protein